MQPAVSTGVGMRLVPSVDDGPIERRLQANLGLEEVRALADLESGLLAALTKADSAGPGDDLARHQKPRELGDDPVERCAPVEQVILVRAVRGSFAVGVVLVETDRAAQGMAGSLRRNGHDGIASL